LANPSDPVFVAEERNTTFLDYPFDIFVSGNYAYTANYNRDSLAIIDISNPNDPVFVAEERNTTLLNGAQGIFVSGKYAYVTNYEYGSLAIIDISDPTDPVFIASERGPTPGISLQNAWDVFVAGNYAYVASNARDAVSIIDVSNPNDPVFLAEERGPSVGSINGPTSIFVSGNYVYAVAFNSNSLSVIDVGGTTISNADIGTAKIGNLDVSNFAQFQQGANFRGSLGVQGSIFAQQGGSFLRFASTTATASTSVVALPAALTATINSTHGGSIVDVLSLSHTATSSIPVAGIGTGILFNAEYAGPSIASTTATTTARIASILTDVTESSPASALTFYTKSGNTDSSLAERMRLTADGRLGIGTTTPYSQLTTWGTGSLFEAVTNSSTTVFSIGQQGATTTALAITNITSTLLKTDSSGNVIPAILGTDYQNFGYLFPGDATTTLLTFSGGASTTDFSANTLAVGGTGTTSIDSTGAITSPSANITTLTVGTLT